MPLDDLAQDTYERIFRVGKHLHDPVPFDPLKIIRDALETAHTLKEPS